ncbi:MAG TPA: HAMP domain-containing sensor histidine kinase [Syntrophales bacterium]|nr:HAMP domain-containing sensor histidine kinase [Syntrophales bacterium]
MDAEMDFSDILASTLHDTKNSMGMLFNTLEEVIGRCKEQDCEAYQGFYTLQYEVKRINNNLIRLLSLYKASRDQFQINVDYYSVPEFVEDVIMQNEPVLTSKGINVEVECPDDLFWTFDPGLVAGVLDNILNNAFRYTRKKLQVSAKKESGYLFICIEDDGSGYPECMLVEMGKDGHFKKNVNFDTGSTGLGLYFAMLVAKSHTNENKKGYISITNGGKYGGGVFTIAIP